MVPEGVYWWNAHLRMTAISRRWRAHKPCVYPDFEALSEKQKTTRRFMAETIGDSKRSFWNARCKGVDRELW